MSYFSSTAKLCWLCFAFMETCPTKVRNGSCWARSLYFISLFTRAQIRSSTCLPSDSGGLHPHSEEYFTKLVHALELDSPIYSSLLWKKAFNSFRVVRVFAHAIWAQDCPHTFQRILNSVFSDLLYQWLIIYIDDHIVWCSDQNEALGQYEKVLQHAVKFGLQFKPTKCLFFSENLEILKHRITPGCRYPTQKGTEAISAMPCPDNVSSVKRFLGMVG